MFGSVRMGGKRLTVFSLLCFLIFLGVCLIMLRASAPDTVGIRGESYPLSVEDDGDIAAFIKACGYEAGELIADGEITVPKIWNDVYSEYNALQRSQGLDLTQYKGKTSRRTVFELKGSDELAELLISGGRIIAAHISGMKPGEAPKAMIDQEYKND